MASKRAQTIAHQLVQQGVPSGRSSPEGFPTFPIPDKLHESLSLLMGKAGTQALFSRALTLTKPDFPELVSVKVSDDGHLEGIAGVLPNTSHQQAVHIQTALVSHIIDLLCTFLGDTLTIRLLQDVSPTALSFNQNGNGKETTS